MGCNGGWYERGFKYYENHHPMSEESYPYTATNGACIYEAKKAFPINN
jgi:hypothetical protein